MKFRSLTRTLTLLGVLAATPGCKDFYDVNVNPLVPSKADLFALLPTTQVAMATGLGNSPSGMSQYTMSLMQQLSNTRGIGAFQLGSDPFSNEWSSLYTDMLVNNEQIINQGTKEQSWTYVGIAQIQKAFVFSQMVDIWGNIPYSEALQGATLPSPRFDRDQDIYNGANGIVSLFSLIDAGIDNLSKSAGASGLAKADLMYGGDKDKWARFGRSLKLKLYNQIRKTRNVSAEVAPLLAPGASLLGNGDDFELKYGASINPDNRNLGYIADYGNSGRENRINPNFYQGMLNSRNYTDSASTAPVGADPRIPYYFYNQVPAGSTTSGQDFVLGNFVTTRFGSTGAFANTAGANVITLPGLYPVGGRYDDGLGGTAIPSSGKGVVAQRLHTYFSRKFTEAELQLTVLNNEPAATQALRLALVAAFGKVNAIAATDGSPTMSRVAINTYIAAAMKAFRTASSVDDKLEVLMYEKYVASFGYGVDMYTDFRRTYHPRILVPGNADPTRGIVDDNDPITQSTGAFPRRLFYSLTDLLLNPNGPRTQPNPVNDRIFWDK